MRNATLDTFGPVLRQLRDGKNLSQDALGEMVGVSGAFISMLESSQRHPNLDMVFRLAEALGVKASEMVSAMEGRLR